MTRYLMILAFLVLVGCEEKRSVGPVGTTKISSVEILRSTLNNYAKTGEGDSGVTAIPDQIQSLKHDNVDSAVIAKLDEQYTQLDKQGLKKTATTMLETLNKAVPASK